MKLEQKNNELSTLRKKLIEIQEKANEFAKTKFQTEINNLKLQIQTFEKEKFQQVENNVLREKSY